MIKMAVRQQDAVKAPKAGPAPQQLALGALTAIDQDAPARRLDQKGRMVALCGRNAGRGPEKCQGEHCLYLSGMSVTSSAQPWPSFRLRFHRLHGDARHLPQRLAI